MTAISAPRRRDLTRLSMTLRAIVAAVIAIVITFSADHSPSLGLAVFGALQIAQGVVVATGARALVSAPGRALVVARAVIGVVIGVIALVVLPGGLLGTLLLLATVAFLLTGALEVIQGVRRADQGPASRDAITAGGLSVLVGVLLSLVAPDAVFTVGLIGAWAAVMAVYLGIAAVSLRPRASTGGAA